MYKFFKRYGWTMWLGVCGSTWDVPFTWTTLIMVFILVILVDWHSGGVDKLIEELRSI